jgi:hypothetical protein
MSTYLLSGNGLFVMIHSYFTSLDIMMCIIIKYLLVCLVKHRNFDLMHSISFFSQIMFDEFITKRERLYTKLIELLLIR